LEEVPYENVYGRIEERSRLELMEGLEARKKKLEK
jgi:hypothetical protein